MGLSNQCMNSGTSEATTFTSRCCCRRLCFGYAGEYDVGAMLLGELILDCTDWSDHRLLRRRSRRTCWWRRQAFAHGDSGEPVAFPSGVVGRLRVVVELARGVKGLLEGEGGQLSRLAALLALGAGLSLRLLIFDCSRLPAAGLCACCRSAAGASWSHQPTLEKPVGSPSRTRQSRSLTSWRSRPWCTCPPQPGACPR